MNRAMIASIGLFILVCYQQYVITAQRNRIATQDEAIEYAISVTAKKTEDVCVDECRVQLERVGKHCEEAMIRLRSQLQGF